LRLLLALAVVAGHAGMQFEIGPRYAVNVFFMISGFYMTLVLNEKYIVLARV
jgi:peptidoglycan/LPS O-acetylase OafA/YrhL